MVAMTISQSFQIEPSFPGTIQMRLEERRKQQCNGHPALSLPVNVETVTRTLT